MVRLNVVGIVLLAEDLTWWLGRGLTEEPLGPLTFIRQRHKRPALHGAQLRFELMHLVRGSFPHMMAAWLSSRWPKDGSYYADHWLSFHLSS